MSVTLIIHNISGKKVRCVIIMPEQQYKSIINIMTMYPIKSLLF